MTMHTLTKIETPFAEKFGVPRQPLLVPEAWGKMRFPKDDFFSEAFRGIENFSHLWLIFEFSEVEEGKFNALVRPPRFEGKKKLGVFATRSPHRPNRLGLSVVKFEKLEFTDKEVILTVSGVDLVNGTPILDIKPYIPYADAITAQAQLFSEAPVFKPVRWDCEKPSEHVLIEKVIALDPRPAFEHGSTDEYGVTISGINVRFKEVEGVLMITELSK